MRFGFALLAAGTLTAAPVPKDFKKFSDKQRLVGTWVGVGQDTIRFQFQEDGTLKTWYGANPGGSAMSWTWAVTDSKSSPKLARITRAENASSWYDCVYDLTGDTMRFALILQNNAPRPDRVEAQPGLEFHSLIRDKPGK